MTPTTPTKPPASPLAAVPQEPTGDARPQLEAPRGSGRRALAGLVLGGLCLLAAGAACNNRLESQAYDDTDLAPPPPDLLFLGPYQDFPPVPVLDTPPSGSPMVPADAPALFGTPDSGAQTGGPCLIEPEIGALYPRNWLRLRARWSAPAGQNLFEVRLHTDNQVHDLVVYTTATQWTMPADMWRSLALRSSDRPVTITIRGAQLGPDGKLAAPPARGSTGDFTIAPADAGGTIVYWTPSGGSGFKGFAIGEESVRPVLRPDQAAPQTKCVGCHSSTPDGKYVAFSQTQDPGNGDPATIGFKSVDGKLTDPPFLTQAARNLLNRTQQQLPTFSPSRWSVTDRIAITALLLGGRYEIVWTDLEAKTEAENTGWGVLSRMDAGKMAGMPVFSHNGQQVVFMASPSVGTAIGASDGDIYTVPYNDRKGGASTPVPGASDPSWNESAPSYAPDDQLLAFNRVPAGESNLNNVKSEVFVVSAKGGTAVRMAANDPPACLGRPSPGILNSWPKWSPELSVVKGRRYYWISFSSSRLPGAPPQLYVAGVVVESTGEIKTYPALYLWNQPLTEGNHTAAWDVFKLEVQ